VGDVFALEAAEFIPDEFSRCDRRSVNDYTDTDYTDDMGNDVENLHKKINVDHFGLLYRLLVGISPLLYRRG